MFGPALHPRPDVAVGGARQQMLTLILATDVVRTRERECSRWPHDLREFRLSHLRAPDLVFFLRAFRLVAGLLFGDDARDSHARIDLQVHDLIRKSESMIRGHQSRLSTGDVKASRSELRVRYDRNRTIENIRQARTGQANLLFLDQRRLRD